MYEIIHVRNLMKSYGKIKALNNVSFDMLEGAVALIGPNGSGKTTLINIIARAYFYLLIMLDAFSNIWCTLIKPSLKI